MENFRQWQRVKEIVGSLLERPPSERAAYLDEACSEDSLLRAEVESLLSAYRDEHGLSEHPWSAILADPGGHPKEIGPYRLLRELGVGGMGQVWLAEQTEPVQRQVALKLIRAGMYDETTVQRFKAERQSLAIMDHPAIAKVFDAGTTPAGQPYLVMEYVDGRLITDYCDSKKLSIRDRLQLFVRVCEGVQHAHQKAVLHRDLKPSNILVVELDSKPVPRIIDFGLAKTTNASPGQKLFTQAGTFLGTPGYMSPEQADPEKRDIDTRTDVYSLGVVLYELLTGLLPVDISHWKQQGPDEILRKLREQDPPRPSIRIETDPGTSIARAAARAMDVKQLVNSLRGDLDWITMRAMEKDRERRYATPFALALDIENYLRGLPVSARPASLQYRIRKYVRRHAAALAVTAAAVVLLIAFAVMQGIELRRITRERDRADRIAEFMTNIFKLSDPSEARGNSVTAREILDTSSQELDTSLARDPELRAEMFNVMGTVYHTLGLYSRAETLLRKGVETQRQILGAENPQTLKTEAQLALTLEAVGSYGESEKLLRQVLAAQQHVLGPEDRTTLATMSNLVWTLDSQTHEQEAESLGRKTLEIQQRMLGKNDYDTLLTMRRLASVLDNEGRYKDAENLFRQTLEISTKTLGREHPETLSTMGDLGLSLTRQGRNSEAEEVLRETLEAQRRILGPEHENTLATLNSLGNALSGQHKLAEAELLYREGAEAASHALGKEHRYTLGMMANVASTMQDEGKYVEAETLDREILLICQRTLGADHPQTASAMFNMADAWRGQHRYAEAESLFRQTIAVLDRTLGPKHPDTIDSVYNLASTLALERNTEESLSTLARAVDAGLPTEDLDKLDNDAAFKTLRANPQFLELVRRAKESDSNAERAN